MNDLELSQIKVELTRLFEEQVEFFSKRRLGELAPVEQHKYEMDMRERARVATAEAQYPLSFPALSLHPQPIDLRELPT